MDLWLNYGERDIDPWYGVDKGNDKEVKKRQDELDDAEWQKEADILFLFKKPGDFMYIYGKDWPVFKNVSHPHL